MADSPYTQYPGQQVATPSAATQQSWQMALNNVGNYQPALTQANNLTQSGANQLGTAANTVQGGLSQIQAAQPAIQQGYNQVASASQPITASQIQNYMNPYQSQVIGGLTSAANTNLFQNIMPQLQSQFVSAGQAASPQQMQAANNAVYQSGQALDQSIASSLQSGYQGALSAAQNEQQAGITGGVDLGQLGTSMGNLGSNEVAAGGQQASIGSATGSLGAQYGQLGALTQQLGAADVGEVAAAGNAQDTNNQANINASMNNFYAQQQWPYQNLAYASNIIRGQAVPSNTMTVGMQPSTSSSYTASPLSSFVGTTLGASSLGLGNTGTTGTTSTTGHSKGGRVGALNAMAANDDYERAPRRRAKRRVA